MRRWTSAGNGILLVLLLFCGIESPELVLAQTAARTFEGRGVILEVKPDRREIVIRHEAITNYMDAMTMPFKVKDPQMLLGLERGDEVTFELHVTEDESWVDHFQKTGKVEKIQTPAALKSVKANTGHPGNSILDYKFTNELGQAVSFHDFRGQALAITFFYTRCPLPDFCPRLSKNFQEAMEKLEALTNAPANWHLISVTFDPQFDTPERLKQYGQSYHYDPHHWSFLTGPPEKIGELAHGAGVEYQTDGGTINHNFRTLIIDPNSHLQMIFPTSGDLSDQIVAEIIKAAAVRQERLKK